MVCVDWKCDCYMLHTINAILPVYIRLCQPKLYMRDYTLTRFYEVLFCDVFQICFFFSFFLSVYNSLQHPSHVIYFCYWNIKYFIYLNYGTVFPRWIQQKLLSIEFYWNNFNKKTCMNINIRTYILIQNFVP